jgi:TonB family protein
MKIVCDACGTRYSIEDSRVAGRSFKIRCKQCAHIILLPGTRAPTAEPAAAGTWHAVIDGMPRPIGVDDLRQLRAAGVLDDRTLVWREGLDDWRALGSVDELRPAGPASVEIAPEVATDSTAVDLPKASSAAGTDAAPDDRPEPAPLRGVRHENSVLFSLGNLARLAAPAPAAASPTGRTEGSGLLDIQSLARSLAPARGERDAAGVGELPVYGALPFGEPAVLIPRPPPRRDRRLIWALAATAGALVAVTVTLVVIVLRGGTAAHASTPPALPAPGASPPALTAPGAGPAPLVNPEATGHTQPIATDPARASAEVTVPSADRTERTTASPSADRTERTTASPSADRTERTTASSSADRTERTTASPGQTGHAGASAAHGGSTVAHGAAATAGSHGSPADPASRRGSPGPASLAPADSAEACSVVTCIVNDYADPCCAVHRRPAAAAPAPAGGELPERLDRPAIAGGLARIDTSECGKQSPAHGEVKVLVQVAPSGAVTGVTVKSSPDPALEACVTAAVRTGAFPATQRGGSFGYAWRF